MAEWLGLHLPGINACFNGTSAVLLLLGYIAIRRGQVGLHLRLMLAALCSSSLFLLGYLTRIYLTGTHVFAPTGTIRVVYWSILGTHMVLAIALLPLLGRALYLAANRRFAAHKRWARVVWPIWMYVSVTGVVVYWMLYQMAPRWVAAAALAAQH